jgi:hypothetical protein
MGGSVASPPCSGGKQADHVFFKSFVVNEINVV